MTQTEWNHMQLFLECAVDEIRTDEILELANTGNNFRFYESVCAWKKGVSVPVYRLQEDYIPRPKDSRVIKLRSIDAFGYLRQQLAKVMNAMYEEDFTEDVEVQS